MFNIQIMHHPGIGSWVCWDYFINIIIIIFIFFFGEGYMILHMIERFVINMFYNRSNFWYMLHLIKLYNVCMWVPRKTKILPTISKHLEWFWWYLDAFRSILMIFRYFPTYRGSKKHNFSEILRETFSKFGVLFFFFFNLLRVLVQITY